MKIELDLNEMLGMEHDEDGYAIGQKNLRSEVVAQMSRDLLHEIRADAQAEFKQTVSKVIVEEIAVVVRAAMAKPIQQSTQWGEKKGDPVTVLELVRTQLEAFLSAPARSRDSYSSNRDPGNLRDLVDEAARSLLTKELQAEISKVRQQINTQIQDHALKAAAAALTQGLKV